MNDYRPLTTEEIEVLKHNDCWAEDWTSVNVSEDFKPNFMHRVMLYGEINIGSFNKNVEVSQVFFRSSSGMFSFSIGVRSSSSFSTHE